MKETYEKIILICYEEDSPQFIDEIASIEEETKRTEDYEGAINNIIDVLSIFSDDVSIESQNKIQEIYEDSIDLF